MAAADQVNSPRLITATVVVVVLATIGALSLVQNRLSYPVMIGILAAVLIAVLVRETVTNGDPVTPAGVVAFTGLLLFVLRPITVANSEQTSPGALADTRFFSASLQDAASLALVEVLLFFLSFMLVYYWSTARQEVAEHGLIAQGEIATWKAPRKARVFSPTMTQWLMLAVTTVAGLLLAYTVLIQVGLGAYLAGLSNRSEFLSGRSYIGLTYVPVQIAIIMNVLVRRQGGLKPWNWASILSFCALVLCASAAGGRGPLIVGVFLPFLILKQLGPNPLRFRTIALLGAGTAAGAMIYSIVLRESAFDGGRSLESLASDPIGVLLDRLTSGIETRPFDVLIRLNEVAALPSFTFQLGSTYATAPAWFIPRALWEDKPFGGGNTWFTSTYVPRFYGDERIETSLSAVGEAFANFGLIGLVVVGGLLGFVASRFTRTMFRRRGILGATMAVVLTPYLFSIIRGDAYQGGSTSIASIAIIAGYVLLTSRPALDGPDAPRLQRTEMAPLPVNAVVDRQG